MGDLERLRWVVVENIIEFFPESVCGINLNVRCLGVRDLADLHYVRGTHELGILLKLLLKSFLKLSQFHRQEGCCRLVDVLGLNVELTVLLVEVVGDHGCGLGGQRNQVILLEETENGSECLSMSRVEEELGFGLENAARHFEVLHED